MNKFAMVTGASKSIGREFARQLSDEGYVVTAVARNEHRLADLCKELGGVHRYNAADLSVRNELGRIQSDLNENHYNLLVNNAVFWIYKKFSKTMLSDIQNLTAVNFDALVALTHSFLKNSRQGDALINVSSTLAYLPIPSAGVYAATKAFVSLFTESLWHEQKKQGVFVMALFPGITESKFHERAVGKPENFSEGMLETPENLVRKTLRVLKKRKGPIYISGLQNRIFAGMSRILTRSAIVQMMGIANFGR